MYDKTTIHFLLLVSCIAFYFLSPDTDVPILTEDVQASEVYSTGKTTWEKVESGVLSEVSIRGKENNNKENGGGNGDKSKLKNKVWTWQVIWCDAECKIETLKDIGIRPEIAERLVNNCKALADDPVMCLRVGASIVTAESSKWWKCKKSNPYNCFWISWKHEYKSYDDAVLHYVWKWNKYWYKAKDMTHFYSPSWKLPPTRFCVSEHSSDSSIGCPNWLKNSSSTFNKLKW